MENLGLLQYHPTVYVFDREYQILIPMTHSALCWVKVGEETYYDHCAGIVRSDTLLHRVYVPQAALDAAGGYTVCYRKMLERLPYDPVTEETVEISYDFKPVPEGEARFCHLSDVHDCIDLAIETAGYMGDYDALILNGDIPNHSGERAFLLEILRLSGALGKGTMPVLFSRGNHDTRGYYGEHFGDYCPHREGRTYFTFRLGDIWGMVLDCGEDKEDSYPAYGHTAAFHSFRLDQTRFIKKVIAEADREYNAIGIKHKVLVCHHPFCHVPKAPFDIEQDIYKEWCDLIGEHIRPEVFIAGHTHVTGLFLPGGELDQLGQFAPVIVGGKPRKKSWKTVEAAYYVLNDEEIAVTIYEDTGAVTHEIRLPRGAQ